MLHSVMKKVKKVTLGAKLLETLFDFSKNNIQNVERVLSNAICFIYKKQIVVINFAKKFKYCSNTKCVGEGEEFFIHLGAIHQTYRCFIGFFTTST